MKKWPPWDVFLQVEVVSTLPGGLMKQDRPHIEILVHLVWYWISMWVSDGSQAMWGCHVAKTWRLHNYQKSEPGSTLHQRHASFKYRRTVLIDSFQKHPLTLTCKMGSEAQRSMERNQELSSHDWTNTTNHQESGMSSGLETIWIHQNLWTHSEILNSDLLCFCARQDSMYFFVVLEALFVEVVLLDIIFWNFYWKEISLFLATTDLCTRAKRDHAGCQLEG